MFKSPMRAGAAAKPKRTEEELLSRPEGATTALNPRARPTHPYLLRLNDYQMDLLRRLAEYEDLSLQKTIKRVLMKAVQAEIKALSL